MGEEKFPQREKKEEYCVRKISKSKKRISLFRKQGERKTFEKWSLFQTAVEEQGVPNVRNRGDRTTSFRSDMKFITVLKLI